MTLDGDALASRCAALHGEWLGTACTWRLWARSKPLAVLGVPSEALRPAWPQCSAVQRSGGKVVEGTSCLKPSLPLLVWEVAAGGRVQTL